MRSIETSFAHPRHNDPVKRSALSAAGALVLASTLAVPAAAGDARTPSASASALGRPLSAAPLGILKLRASLAGGYRFGAAYCAPDTPAGVACVRFAGRAAVPGLGRATETYTKTASDPRYGCRWVTEFGTAVIQVAGKGEIHVSMAERACSPYGPAEVGPLAGTVTGGSGVYAGASGSVRFTSFVSTARGLPSARFGTFRDTWTGTLIVPGLEFDATPPVLTGVRSFTVRAPRGARRVRVRYRVSARDAVDGPTRVACEPRSGSRFALGPTRVVCTAEDSSANSVMRGFTVTVKPNARG